MKIFDEKLLKNEDFRRNIFEKWRFSTKKFLKMKIFSKILKLMWGFMMSEKFCTALARGVES